MIEPIPFQRQISQAVEELLSVSHCDGKRILAPAQDLYEFGQGTGCDDIPLQVSQGPLGAKVGLMRFGSFSLGFSVANQDLVFEQKSYQPALCLHTDNNRFDIVVMDRPGLLARPAKRPSICLIFHEPQVEEVSATSLPAEASNIADFWTSANGIFAPPRAYASGDDVRVDAHHLVRILTAFYVALAERNHNSGENSVQRTLQILDIFKKTKSKNIECIADILQMSTRNLNYKSVKEVGVSPRKIIKSYILRNAMLEIAKSGINLKKIGDIAFEVGYEDFSRFSYDYYSMFGEKPSATYRRYVR